MGGVIGGVVVLLVFLALVMVIVYLLRKNKSNYEAMSAVGMHK